MNRPADAEQTLTAFFAAGPTQMPDRVFDAVFDQVERTPQRRLARLHLRFNDMSTTARLLAAGAAAVLVIGVGFAALGRGPGPGTGPIESPSASPTASSGAAGVTIPAELQHGFLGPMPTGPDAPVGQERALIEFTATAFDFNSSILFSTASAPSPGIVRLVSTSGLGGCSVGDEGRYGWTLSPGGNRLTVVVQQDACAKRAAAVAGEWLRSNCADDQALCLGPLEPGSYSSASFEPFIPWDATWRARFGALRYTVPAGWANTFDYPQEYVISRSQGSGDAGIHLFSEIVIVSESDPCSETRDPKVGRTAQAMTDWLAGASGVVSTDPVAVSIGGLDGWRLDLSMDPAWTTTCPYSGGKPTRPLFTDPNPAPGLAWNIGPEGMMRLYVLDLGDGRSLVVDIEAGTKAEYDAILADATAIVESFSFPR
jgi:hypothetical protein